jgi:hypothetical protein
MSTMRAMVLEAVGQPLVLRELPIPQPEAHQVLIRVQACAVCRTDLHIVDGELPNPKLPLILGHEIVGEVAQLGAEVSCAAGRAARRRAVAGLDLRHMSVLRGGAREPVPVRQIHGLHAGRRLRRVRRRRRPLCVPHPRRLRRSERSAAVVRRADWLPLVPYRAARDGGQSAGAIRLSARRRIY